MKKVALSLIIFLIIGVIGFLGLSILTTKPALAQTPGTTCRSSQLNQIACYNNQIVVRCTRVRTRDGETIYIWRATGESCSPTPTATPSVPRISITPPPPPDLPPGVRWISPGISAIRCSSADGAYRVEFNYVAQFLSYDSSGLYRSKFTTVLTETSHPSDTFVVNYGWMRCNCEEGSGMCLRDCNNNSQLCGICVPCTYHDNTTSDNLDQDMLACPRPASVSYTTPLTNYLRGIGATAENIIEERGKSECGSYQTDLWAPRSVTFRDSNGPMLTCTRAPHSLVNWTLLYTDRDCVAPTPTTPPPPTTTLTSTPTLTPTPTIKVTPPVIGKKMIGMQVKTFSNRPTRVNISLGVAPLIKPYISKLNFKQMSPNIEATGTDYNRDTKQIILDLVANQEYKYQFCVLMTSGISYCDTFLVAAVGDKDGVHEYLTFKTGANQDKIYNLWISW